MSSVPINSRAQVVGSRLKKDARTILVTDPPLPT
jgi:hypothetical protein